MLRRIPASDLQTTLVIGVFALTLAVFAFFFFRALRLKKEVADYLGSLPLDEEPPAASQPHIASPHE